MAESLMTSLVKRRGLSDMFWIASSATSAYETGNPPHKGTADKLKEKGIPLVPHRAVTLVKEDYDRYDYIIGMDSANIRDIKRITGGDGEGKVYSFLSFAGASGDIADPWYTGDFEATYKDICRASLAFLHRLEKEGRIPEKPKKVSVRQYTTCDSCANLEEDEEGALSCGVNLDEDDRVRFASSAEFSCPLYVRDDEYAVVRKQN